MKILFKTKSSFAAASLLLLLLGYKSKREITEYAQLETFKLNAVLKLRSTDIKKIIKKGINQIIPFAFKKFLLVIRS